MELLGLVTFGHVECGDSEAPSLYENVGSFASWIQAKLQ